MKLDRIGNRDSKQSTQLESTSEHESEHETEQIQRTGSNFSAYFNVVCAVAGAGTLGMPYSFRQGGWIAASFIFISGVVAWYTGVLLIECIYFNPSRRLSSYPSIGEAAFGPSGRNFVQVFHFAILLGVSALFVMVSGINLHLVATANNVGLSLETWKVISGVIILIPYALIKNMKEMTALSIFGVITTVATVAIASGVGLLNMPENVAHTSVNFSSIPLSLATIGFSFGGNVIYTHVEASMKSPKAWPRVLGFALATVSILYLVMGIVGYRVYGDTVQTPIILSLPEGTSKFIVSIVITLHLLLAAPLTLIAFSIEVENSFQTEKLGSRNAFLVQVGSRTLVMVLLTLVAIYVPYFGSFMSLIGAISNLVVIYVTPVACHLKLFGWRNRSFWTYASMFICVLMGFFGGVLGAISAVYELAQKFGSGAE